MKAKRLPNILLNLIISFFLLIAFSGTALCIVPDSSVLANANGTIEKNIDSWSLTDSLIKPYKIIFTFRNEENFEVKVHLVNKDQSQASFSKTDSFNIFYKANQPVEKNSQQKIAGLMLKLTELIRSNDHGQYNFLININKTENSNRSNETEKNKNYFSSWGKIPVEHELKISASTYWYVDVLERITAIALFIPSVIGLFILLPLLVRRINLLSPKHKLWFMAVLFAGLLIHILVPHRLVMTYSGYGIMQQAMDFAKLKKYGAGTPFFYHFFYLFLPNTDKVYLWLNTITGWLTLVLASIWFSRYMKQTALILALLFLLSIDPLVLKDHNSESNFIPTLFFFFAALNWLDCYRENKSIKNLIFTTTTFLFPIYSRPFFIIFVPFAILMVQLTAQTKPITKANKKPVATAFISAFIILLPHIAFLLVSYFLEMETGHSEGFIRVLDALKSKFFDKENLFIRFDMTPFMFILLWPASIFFADKKERLKLILLFVLAFMMFCLYFIDSPPPSLPRLQMVPHYLFCMISAFGLLKAQQFITSKKKHLLAQTVLPALILLSVYPATSYLWTPINDWAEDKALRRSAELIPEKAEVLARLAVSDNPATFGLFRDTPDYLFQLKAPELQFVTLSKLLSTVEKAPETEDMSGRFYVYLGMRCYALILNHLTGKDFNGNTVDENYMHPMCKKIREKLVLKPIYETSAVNHEMEFTFVWYAPKPQLQLGLYEIQGLKQK